MQLAAEVAQPFDEGTFDVCVNVFELDGERKFAALDLAGDDVKGGRDPLGLVTAEQTDLRQHAGVSLAGGDVVAVQAAVETDRFGERLDAVVGLPAEAAAPGFVTHGVPLICRLRWQLLTLSTGLLYTFMGASPLTPGVLLRDRERQ